MSTRRLFTQFDTGTPRPPFDAAEICGNPAGFYANYHRRRTRKGRSAAS